MRSGGRGLCAGSFGLSVGIIWGLWCFFAGILFHGDVTMVGKMGTLYVGYGPTLMGSLIGGLWGLLHGFIFAFLVALLYNGLCRCCRCRCCKKTCCACGNKDCDGTNCKGNGCNTNTDNKKF
jgi:hypothetical protein